MADRVPRPLPAHATVLTDTNEVFKRLKRNHGIDPATASERLHALKKKSGRGADDNVIFGVTGCVYDSDTREWLGSLTEGGK
jgi:hypothetical protein